MQSKALLIIPLHGWKDYKLILDGNKFINLFCLLNYASIRQLERVLPHDVFIKKTEEGKHSLPAVNLTRVSGQERFRVNLEEVSDVNLELSHKNVNVLRRNYCNAPLVGILSSSAFD